MFVKTVAVSVRLALVVIPVAAVAAAGCGGGSQSTGTAGTTGAAGSGSPGTGGTTGSAGSTGSGGQSCPVATATSADATILDFEAVSAGAAQATFGGYMPGTFGGGTFIYPDKGIEADLMGLANDFDGKSWHITGLVKKYAGFGLYLTSTSDVSMFSGIQFDIKGTLTPNGVGTGAAPTAQATMTIVDVAHLVDSAHTADGRMTCGTCAPASEYDGTCANPNKIIPLTDTVATQSLRWSDFIGGRRPPNFNNESANAAQITAISWVLPWRDGAAQYTVDITVDNIKLMAP